ncbi:MAG: murein biosynthesis integral membrane protein MurJ [Alphaproteobacteria bacterium]|nr:murein biosynthesis integral membrane protein MurJ [Alphaproteobacteria bacterium]
MALLRGIATIGANTMASRVLGFIRDVMMAALVGAGGMADAFFVAFQFPNLFRRLFAEGAFNSAFVPLFAGTLQGQGQDAAREFAGRALSVLLAVVIPFTVLVEIAMPWLMMGFAPGFSSDAGKFALSVQLTRICFPYLLVMALVSMLGAVVNAIDRFAVAAAAPILLNIIMILALLGPVHWTTTPGHALAWAVALAGIAQFLWLAQDAARAGMLPRLPAPRLTPDIRRLFALMLPGIFGASMFQLNQWLGTVLASLLPSGAISYLWYADRVNQLPLSVVGVAVGVALLPLLSRQLRAGALDAARANQNRAIEFALLLTLPAAAALLVSAWPIIAVLFQRGAFDWQATDRTAATLTAFATGLPAYVLIKALSPGFFAREDMTTPVKIGVASMVVNIAVAAALMIPFQQIGIAVATSASSWVNALALGWVLWRRGFLAPDERLKQRLGRILAATLLMAAALAATQWGLGDLFRASTPQRVAALAVLIGTGLAVFGAACLALGAARLGDLRAALGRKT